MSNSRKYFKTFEEWLQSRLTAHGFPCGVIDGIVGKNTRAALRRFQKANNLPVTIVADKATVEALRKPANSHIEKILERDDDNLQVTYPDTFKNKYKFPRQRDVSKFYGRVGSNQTKIRIPWKMRLAWDKRRVVTHMTLHRKCADSALEAMEKALDIYKLDGIKHLGLDLFGGSLNVRKMRGGSRWSMHAYGCSIDFDPARNRFKWKKPKARLSHSDAVDWWKCWEEQGWVSLGRVRNFDWMHVQAARL